MQLSAEKHFFLEKYSMLWHSGFTDYRKLKSSIDFVSIRFLVIFLKHSIHCWNNMEIRYKLKLRTKNSPTTNLWICQKIISISKITLFSKALLIKLNQYRINLLNCTFINSIFLYLYIFSNMIDDYYNDNAIYLCYQ